MVFRRRRNGVIPAGGFRRSQDTQNCEVVRLRTSAREEHFAGLGADCACNRCARLLKSRFRFTTVRMRRGRIRKLIGEKRHHCLNDLLPYWCGRGMIQIDAFHGLNMGMREL